MNKRRMKEMRKDCDFLGLMTGEYHATNVHRTRLHAAKKRNEIQLHTTKIADTYHHAVRLLNKANRRGSLVETCRFLQSTSRSSKIKIKSLIEEGTGNEVLKQQEFVACWSREALLTTMNLFLFLILLTLLHVVKVGTSTNITQISATVSPICRMGSLQVPMECRPQQWGAIDSGIINASLVMLGRACKSTKELLPVGSAVLVERGTCPFSTKAGIAKDAGAVAIIFFDPNDPLVNRTIVTTGTALDVPIVSIGRANGEQLTKSLRNSNKEPYLVSILFSSKWQLERSEDKWRRITALPGAKSEAFLFHGSILAQLRRHGQARTILQKAIKVAEVEGEAEEEEEQNVDAETFCIGLCCSLFVCTVVGVVFTSNFEDRLEPRT